MHASQRTWLKRIPQSSSVVLVVLLVVAGCSKSEPDGAAPSVDVAEVTGDINADARSVAEPEGVPVVNATTDIPAETSEPTASDQDDGHAGANLTGSQVEDAETATEPAEQAAAEPQDPPAHDATNAKPSMAEALADLKIPPAWLESVEVDYDTNKPWGEARLEIRRLLSLRGEHCKQAIKLTCIYREKDDIGNGHEYPMYLYLGGELAWSLVAYQEFTRKLLADDESHDIHTFLSLASNYTHFGEHERALETLKVALTRLPGPPWRIARQADIDDAFGDVYAELGDVDTAKHYYAEAIRLYPTSNQPYGRHQLVRRARKVQSKVDLLDRHALESAALRDGTYETKALGYVGDIEVTVTITAGRIADIKIKHEEKIDQNACRLIPERIIAAQSLDVDAITSATVTVDAIIDGTFQALKKAGLK